MFKLLISKIKILCDTRYLVKKIMRLFIVNQAAIGNYETIVDIGAGKAPYKKIFKYKKYIICDVENKYNFEDIVIIKPNDILPLKDDYADLALSTEVLEHVKDIDLFLSEIYRIMKSGGKLIMTTPFLWPVHEAPNDYRRFTNFGIKHLLTKKGFKNIKIIRSNGFLFTLCQLIVMNLKARIFVPIVIVFNLIGRIIYKIEKNKNLYLINFIIATK